MRLSIEIKLVDDAWCHRLMVLTEIEQKAIRSSGKKMDDSIGIILLHSAHMIGYLFGERGRRAPHLRRSLPGPCWHCA